MTRTFMNQQREEIAQLKRKSARLKQIVKQEEAEFVQAAVRFARLVSSGRSTDTSADTSPERTPEGAEGVTIEGHKEVASIIDDGDEVEDVFDSVSVPDPRDPLGLGVARPPIRSSGDSIYTSSLTPRQIT